MTDREMLMIAYGALKADKYNNEGVKMVIEIIETYLFSPLRISADGSLEPLITPSEQK